MAYIPSQQLIVLSFQDPAGNPLAGGNVILRLNMDGSVSTASGVQISANKTVSASLDSTGTATINLWLNSDISPSGSVYFVDAYTIQGEPAWSGQMTFSLGSIPEYILLEDGSLIWLESGEPDAILTE